MCLSVIAKTANNLSAWGSPMASLGGGKSELQHQPCTFSCGAHSFFLRELGIIPAELTLFFLKGPIVFPAAPEAFSVGR